MIPPYVSFEELSVFLNKHIHVLNSRVSYYPNLVYHRLPQCVFHQCIISCPASLCIFLCPNLLYPPLFYIGDVSPQCILHCLALVYPSLSYLSVSSIVLLYYILPCLTLVYPPLSYLSVSFLVLPCSIQQCIFSCPIFRPLCFIKVSSLVPPRSGSSLVLTVIVSTLVLLQCILPCLTYLRVSYLVLLYCSLHFLISVYSPLSSENLPLSYFIVPSLVLSL